MFLHVRRRGEVSRRPCMLIKFDRSLLSASAELPVVIISRLPVSFCVLKFRNAPAPDVCAGRAYGVTRFSSSPRRARVFGCVHHSTKASCAGASFTVAVSYGAWLLRSPRAVDLLTVDARFALDQQRIVRRQFVRGLHARL